MYHKCMYYNTNMSWTSHSVFHIQLGLVRKRGIFIRLQYVFYFLKNLTFFIIVKLKYHFLITFKFTSMIFYIDLYV